MKTRILALILVVVTILSAMTSCDFLNGIIYGEVAEQGDVTVVVENEDGTYSVYKTYLEEVENKDKGAEGIVEYLNKRENNPITVQMIDSGYGAYVTEIGSIKEDGANKKYVMVYTSVASDSYDGAPTVDYEGTTMYQSGVGLSGMKVEAGTIILFRLEVSNW